ncbi:hypothetical protein HDU97_004646 [Phlyctochytrium planicorne]|nr:hypothetical protein HDU97_004646 [Phlyctochytrium planicorne]
MDASNLRRILRKYDGLERAEFDEIEYIHHIKNIAYIKEQLEKLKRNGMPSDAVIAHAKRITEIEGILSSSTLETKTSIPNPKIYNEEPLIPESDPTDTSTAEQQRLQEMYSEDLLRMANILKASSVQFGELLKEDNKVRNTVSCTINSVAKDH